MHLAVALVTLLFSFQLLNCHGATSNPRLNFFDIDLLRYTAEDKKGNVMVSPASIKSTLAMLLEGAEGATAAEIRSALRVSPTKDDYRMQLNDFIRALEANSSKVFLQNANALFVSKKLKLKKDYEYAVKSFYYSEVGRMDFNDPKSSADTINAWASSKTQGLIPVIVDEAQVTPGTDMLITNALYFKAPWKHGFDVRSTHSDCFYNNGVCRNVVMMDLQAELKYAFVRNLRAHALELPYQDDRYSMLLLIPQDRDAGMALIRDLPYIGLPQISDLLEPSDVILTMPKFNVEYSENMIEALRNMRITSLFSPSANLSGIFETADAPHLNSMYHCVHMKVDEVGTVAAAATISMVVPLINNQVQLRVDRPFLFFIKDNKLGLVLFEGKIEEPTEFIETPVKGLPVRGQPSQPIPIRPFSSQEAPRPNFNQAFPNRANLNQEHSSPPNVIQGGTNLAANSNQEVPYQPSVQQPSQSQPISTSSPSTVASEPAESQNSKKTGGISGWFKKLGSYF